MKNNFITDYTNYADFKDYEENSFITNYPDYADIQYYMKNNSITDYANWFWIPDTPLSSLTKLTLETTYSKSKITSAVTTLTTLISNTK